MQSSITGNGTSHIYYNVTITNNDTTGTSAPPNLDFNETRNQPYLNKPEDYYMSVIRFSVDTPTLPLFIPQPEVGSTDPNKLIYSVSLEYNSTVIQTYLSFIPQLNDASSPAVPIQTQDITNRYYYLYSYQWFIDQIVNPAFTACYQALAKAESLPSTVPPLVIWDSGSCTAVLNADIMGYDFNLANPIKIYMNTPMYDLFSSFSSTYLGTDAPNGKNFLINCYNNGFNTWKVSSSGITYVQVQQEYSTAPLWNPVKSIVFSTSLMPIIPELDSAPAIYNGGSGFTSSGNNSNITNILTDLEVPLTLGYETKPTINYAPQSEYRFTDLFGTNPVSSINITVYWKDKFAVLHPFQLASGGTANVKILFRSKSFFTNYIGY